MPNKITLEQYRELFNKLPQETQDLILSEETAKSVVDACLANDIDVDKFPEVGKYVGYVLAGAMEENNFAAVLEKEVGLEKDIAKNIAQDIAADVFSKVGEGGGEVRPPLEVGPQPVGPQTPRRKDVYREAIE